MYEHSCTGFFIISQIQKTQNGNPFVSLIKKGFGNTNNVVLAETMARQSKKKHNDKNNDSDESYTVRTLLQ